VTIEVGAADLKDEHLAQHLGLVAGQYATMAITDTGRGMTPEVKARAFQPFFTTKEFGKGPGLGLAAVHGIVNQSGGSISIRSQLGIGTTFTIYLPQVAEQEKRVETGMPLRPSSKSLLGSEIILVVENHPQLRTLFRECLDTLGYKVLTANLGTEAIRIAEELRQDIHLLVTDVLLTDMNGRQLVKQLKTFHRNMKVIYVSGYSDSAFGRPGEPASGDVLMEKPFALEKLARTIRHMLDGKTSSATEQPGVLDVVEPLP
jgi:CheY-like chemotaxis protein